MKGVLKFLLGAALGASLGWAAGFLRFPAMERNQSFWLGFAACTAAVVFLLALLFVWNKNRVLMRLIGKGGSNPRRVYAAIWIVVGAFIVLGGSAASWMAFRQNKHFKYRSHQQDKKIQELTELVGSLRNNNMGSLVGNVLDKVDDELKSNPQGPLSESTIGRVAALAYSFKPYRYFAGDSLAQRKLSPERGQLLLALANMGIDSASFHQIRLKAPFFGADLHGANLKGADLSEADLRGADLKEADLSGAELSGADLEKADLWGANLDGAKLTGANLRRADLRWAEMNKADLQWAILNGADLSSAKLRNADLRKAEFQWAFARGAMFNGANLACTDMLGTDLKMANLRQANLREANLMAANLEEARLTGADLTHTSCGNDILDNMTQWRIDEAAEFQAMYKVVDDTVRPFVSAIFRLEKVGE